MRMTLEQAEERAENRSNFNFINELRLSDDGDGTIVRFLFDEPSDIEVHGIHTIRMTSNKSGKSYPVQIDCLGDGCPLCKEALNHKDEMFPLVSRVKDNIYLPLIAFYDTEGKLNPEYKVFVRSTNYFKNTLAPYIKRNDIRTLVEIERAGAKGSKKPNYNLYEAKKDYNGKLVTDKDSELYVFASKSLAELKEDFEVKDDDICGRTDSLIRTWTPEMVEMFLENPSVYPNLNAQNTEDTKEEEVPVRRRSSNHGF